MDLRYKIHLASDLVVKFHGDRPRELGDLVAKEKKHHGYDKAFGTNVPGGLIMHVDNAFFRLPCFMGSRVIDLWNQFCFAVDNNSE